MTIVEKMKPQKILQCSVRNMRLREGDLFEPEVRRIFIDLQQKNSGSDRYQAIVHVKINLLDRS